MGDVRRTLDGVWRIESARLIAGVARIVRDVGLAEDLAQEAFVAALEQWPESGVPDNPGAWLMVTAKHRAIDRLRRAEVHERKTRELAREIERSGARDLGGRQAAEQAQRQGDPRVGREHRMAGREDEPQQVVVERIVDRGGQVRVLVGAAPLELARKLLRLSVVHAGAAQAIDRAMLGGGHEPGTRIVRDT